MVSRPKGIAILLPSSGRLVHIQWSIALGHMMAAPPVGQNMFVHINIANPKNKKVTRDEQREQLVEEALKTNPEYIMWVDDDTIPPPNTLLELFYVMSQNPNAAIVGGIYMTKTNPPQPIVFMELGAGPFWLWTIGDIFKCKGLGTGCMLVRAEVFKKIPQPWFKDTSEANPGDTEVVNGQEIRMTSRTGTDDMYFCKKVDEAGYDIIAHAGILPAHLDYSEDPVIAYKLPMNSYPVVSYQRKLDMVNAERAEKGLPPVQILPYENKVVL